MKSIETKFNEALAAIKKAGRTKQYEEASKTCSNIESKLNCAEEVLKDAGIVRESKPIKKNNGTGDNFVENNPFGKTVEEFRESSFSPGYTQANKTKTVMAKSDKVMADSMLKRGEINEAQHRKLTGQKPEGYEKLSEQQKKDFDFARLVGISESDAFKLAAMTGKTFREVSRR